MSINAKWVFKRSDGRELVFGNDTFQILEMNGIDTLKPELFSKKKARGDGNIITGKRMPAREFSVTAELFDAKENAKYRSVLNSFFSHRYTYDVTITYINEPRYVAHCELMLYQCPTKNVFYPLKPKITMLAPDGYFLSVDSFGQDIAGTRGGAGFPYVNLVNKTFAFGIFEFKGNATFENDGDVEAYVKASITFRGNVVNPKLIMGESYVKVIDTFVPGDILVIDASDKSLTKNGVNIDNRLEKGSKWLNLTFDVGENLLSYDADSGNNLMMVRVYFNKRYLGV